MAEPNVAGPVSYCHDLCKSRNHNQLKDHFAAKTLRFLGQHLTPTGAMRLTKLVLAPFVESAIKG
jgi:hypothetical protein